MTNDETNSNAQMTNGWGRRISSSGFGLARRSRAKAAHSFGIRHWSFVIFIAATLQLFNSSHLTAAPFPPAKDILDSVRMLESRQQLDLDGQLRENDSVIPFHLNQNGPLIRYSFTNPDEVLQLRLGESGSRLEVVSDSGSQTVPASRLDQKIRGTGVTYEDLALKFLYWPNAEVVGEQNVRTRNCWKLQLHAPLATPEVRAGPAVSEGGSRQSQYSNVFLWIDKVSGALMRMEGYDRNGQLAKRFEVVSAQKIDNRWFLKQMRIEELRPGTTKVLARTYLEIKR
jgi:hypothetical protein